MCWAIWSIAVPRRSPRCAACATSASSAVCLLGNHDWHLLAVAEGVRPKHRSDTLDDILDAPDREAWLDWLRQRPMAVQAHGWLMLHAGVAPQWDLALTLELASGPRGATAHGARRDFLDAMFGNQPARWSDALGGRTRLRFALNTLTRIRFVAADGTLDFGAKGGLETAPAGHCAWFDAPGRRTAGVPIAFGHWSAIGLIERDDLLSLDTGCAWGGRLTAVRIDGGRREIVQVDCSDGGQRG